MHRHARTVLQVLAACARVHPPCKNHLPSLHRHQHMCHAPCALTVRQVPCRMRSPTHCPAGSVPHALCETSFLKRSFWPTCIATSRYDMHAPACAHCPAGYMPHALSYNSLKTAFRQPASAPSHVSCVALCALPCRFHARLRSSRVVVFPVRSP